MLINRFLKNGYFAKLDLKTNVLDWNFAKHMLWWLAFRPEAYLKPSRTSVMDLFNKNSQLPLAVNFFEKKFTINTWQSPKYVSVVNVISYNTWICNTNQHTALTFQALRLMQRQVTELLYSTWNAERRLQREVFVYNVKYISWKQGRDKMNQKDF